MRIVPRVHWCAAAVCSHACTQNVQVQSFVFPYFLEYVTGNNFSVVAALVCVCVSFVNVFNYTLRRLLVQKGPRLLSEVSPLACHLLSLSLTGMHVCPHVSPCVYMYVRLYFVVHR